MDSTFSKNLRELRKNSGMSQEQLAEKFGITVQAVSKWECALSYPDIELLPKLADLFRVTVDALLRKGDSAPLQTGSGAVPDLPDDDVLRIVQCKGRTLLRQTAYDPDKKIPLLLDSKTLEETGKELRMEIWGSAQIEGDISGNLHAGDGVNCGNVGGSVEAGDGVNCGNVGGSVEAGDGVNCGNIGGSVEAGDGVTCGNVGGSVEAGDGVNCGDIHGDVSCEDDLHCREIRGTVKCAGDIYYDQR